MLKRRIFIATGLVILIALVAAMVLSAGFFQRSSPSAQAQTQGSDMQQRLDQVIDVLKRDPGPAAVGAAIDDGMEILYGGFRPLPSKDDLEHTQAADQMVSGNELKFANALNEFVQKGKSSEQKGRALDLKLLVEQMNEVARAVGAVTARCGDGDSLDSPTCSELQPLLDEETGQEMPVRLPQSNTALNQIPPGLTIHPGFSVKLRSPFVPQWFGNWQEDVRVTAPIPQGACAVVFKETRGLMLRLYFDRIIIVTDPWVSTFGVPRGTRIPIWRLEWIPSEYVKEWNICNAGQAGGSTAPTIVKTVTQRVVQDIPLKYFWRFYPKDP